MRSLTEWLIEYSQDHRNISNQRLHLICVPLIFASIVGALHLLPHHLGDLLILLPLIWYALLGMKALTLMVVQSLVALILSEGFALQMGMKPTLAVFACVFVLAWCGQFYGHRLEGRKPSFVKDLQYLLVGPLWVWLGH